MAGGHIIVDRTQKTNIDGVYAAGDCTGRPYQYAKAVGEGNVAVHSVLDYLKKHKDNQFNRRRLIMGEIWDIYDVNKQLTGRTMKRNDWNMKDGDYH